MTSRRLLRYAILTTVAVAVKGNAMVWTTPTLVEICIGLEINGYLPAEF
ncbi:MAG TPA: pyrroloquinoline quinone precursor peptide PqqA [Pseudolabrys sp.]|nr:pyrroloquinoline quinone precursor peptide PqqA [Pseudolabrys sp.]